MAGPAKTPEELQALLASNPAIQPSTALQAYASSLQVLPSANDYALMFSLPRPVMIGSGDQLTQAAMLEPVVIVHVGPGTLKDVSLLLSATVAQYEKEWGVIETEYTRRLAKEAASTTKK